MNGYSIVLIPRSWAFGVWWMPHKSLYAFGPFRFAIHRGLGAWKSFARTRGFHGGARSGELGFDG